MGLRTTKRNAIERNVTPVARAGAVASRRAAREIALVTQILTSAADMAENVSTQADVTILALVTWRPPRIFPSRPGREALIADAFVRQGVCGGRHLRVPTTAEAAGKTARAAVLARASGTAFAGEPAVAGAVFDAGVGALRGRTVAFGLLAGRRLRGLRGLRRDRKCHFALRNKHVSL